MSESAWRAQEKHESVVAGMAKAVAALEEKLAEGRQQHDAALCKAHAEAKLEKDRLIERTNQVQRS